MVHGSWFRVRNFVVPYPTKAVRVGMIVFIMVYCSGCRVWNSVVPYPTKAVRVWMMTSCHPSLSKSAVTGGAAHRHVFVSTNTAAHRESVILLSSELGTYKTAKALALRCTPRVRAGLRPSLGGDARMAAVFALTNTSLCTQRVRYTAVERTWDT